MIVSAEVDSQEDEITSTTVPLKKSVASIQATQKIEFMAFERGFIAGWRAAIQNGVEPIDWENIKVGGTDNRLSQHISACHDSLDIASSVSVKNGCAARFH